MNAPSIMRFRQARGRGRHKRVERAIAAVEYILERKGDEFGWENLPWLIQYYPLIIKFFPHLKKVAAVNPGIDGFGGLIGASKMTIFGHLATSSYAKTLYVKSGSSRKEVTESVREQFPRFPELPLICKPNMGERAIDVKKISSFTQLGEYLHKARKSFLVQEYVPGPEELGVSCFRNLETGKLEIAAIVRRVIVKSRGDGSSTIRQLISALPIPHAIKDKIAETHTDAELEEVPSAGKVVLLSPVASLAYGTVIEEVSRERYAEGFASLEKHLNEICINDEGVAFSGFNYGRFDYRAKSLEELFAGKGKILELNGTASMALHACIPGLPIDRRYEIFSDFFSRMVEIAEYNRKTGKGRYLSLLTLYLRSWNRLHGTSVQWDAITSSFREIREARRALKKLA